MQSKIKSFQDACKDQKISPTKLPDVSMLSEPMGKYVLAAYKLAVITVSLNKIKTKVWLPNWHDSSSKYQIWFDMDSPSGLVLGAVFGFFSDTYVGSRLCFRTREIAEYAGKQFIELYKDFMLFEK